jgi:hypothetical protein
MIFAVIGRREMGKTTLGYFIARQTPHRMIFDPRGLVHTGGYRVATIEDVDKASGALADDQIQEMIVTPDNDVQRTFVALCGGARHWIRTEPHKPLAILVDEVRFVDTRGVPSFDWALRCAPRDMVHMIITAHRPSDVSVDVRAITDHFLLFQSTQEHDLDVIEKRCNAKTANQVARLKPREFVHWDDAKGEMKVCRDPRSWFVSLTPNAKESQGSPAPTLPPAEKIGVDKRDLFS